MLFSISSTMKLYSFLLALVIATTNYYLSSTTTTTVYAITVDLIHRDSPLSPLYDPSQSNADRVYNAFTRSSSRAANGFKPSQLTSTSPQTLIQPGPGDYLMNLSLGTPPFSTIVVADTGSDLVWTQCQPCSSCFSQSGSLYYDPTQSSTYTNLPCESESCTSSGTRTQCDNGNCIYAVGYVDGSSSSGNLATDTVTLGDTPIPNVVVGCGHDNYFPSDSGGASGIAGLGGGPLSLVSQMGPLAAGKFSYCLVPLLSSSTKTSKLSFGPDATVSGAGAVSTPLVTRQDPTFYYLTLEGMSVGDKRLSVGEGSTSPSEGNIIIDSGSTLTVLESSLYDGLVSALADVISGERVNLSDPTYLCYRSESEVFEAAPIITVHFGGGADVKLNPINTFMKIDEGVACLAMIPSENDLATYGNVAQKNFLVGYDIEGKKVSFMPTDCTQY